MQFASFSKRKHSLSYKLMFFINIFLYIVDICFLINMIKIFKSIHFFLLFVIRLNRLNTLPFIIKKFLYVKETSTIFLIFHV